MVAPVAQVRREREPDVGRAGERRRAVDEGPAAVDPARKERRVLVLRWHRRAEPGERPEVAGDGQRHERAAPAEGRIRDCPFLALGQPGDPRILDTPDFLREVLGVGHEGRLGVDVPSGPAVVAARDREVRDAPKILDAQQQDALAVDRGRRGVEHRVRPIRDVRRAEDRRHALVYPAGLGCRYETGGLPGSAPVAMGMPDWLQSLYEPG